MDENNMDNLVNKIAADETDSNEPLMKIDEKVDLIIDSITTIGEELKKITPISSQEAETLRKIKDILESGVAPYTADIAQLLDSLEVE